MLQDSPPGSLREVNIEARRRRILAAARGLIAAGGMQALSMRKLAAEAGLSVTTLYNLFGVRDEILLAIIEDAVDQMIPILDAEAPLADPLERCRAVITVSIRHFAENEAVYRPMLVACYEGLSLSISADRRIADRASNMQREGIEQAIEQGLLVDDLDAGQLAEQIYHGYELACLQWAYGRLDEAGFRARALYGLHLVLLAVAADRIRPELLSRLQELERELASASSGGVRRPRRKRRA
ncbi:MAG: TetR/AcrR family transcriptional regulator [Myxococcota bacterium]|nr:TetR/AcrR family transcriptional regulator [Myxococcota bacterium]